MDGERERHGHRARERDTDGERKSVRETWTQRERPRDAQGLINNIKRCDSKITKMPFNSSLAFFLLVEANYKMSTFLKTIPKLPLTGYHFMVGEYSLF